MYFLRSPLQIYTTDNFLKTIFCGNINKDKTKSFFKFLQNIYAPVALNNNEWPESTFLYYINHFIIINKFITNIMYFLLLYSSYTE